MTSPTIPAPTAALSFATATEPVLTVRTPPAGLPVARTADAVEHGTPLVTRVRACGETTVLRADGEVDLLTLDQLRVALDRSIAAGRTVVADLRGVSFVDCAGVGLIADARRRAHRRGVRLEVVPGRAVARTAALLGLTAALGVTEHAGRA